MALNRKKSSSNNLDSELQSKRKKRADILDSKRFYFSKYLNMDKLKCIKDSLPLRLLNYAAVGLQLEKPVTTDDPTLKKNISSDPKSTDECLFTNIPFSPSPNGYGDKTSRNFKRPQKEIFSPQTFSSKENTFSRSSGINRHNYPASFSRESSVRVKTFVPDKTTLLEEMDLYKKLVQLSVDNNLFYPNNKLPPMKNLKDCKEKFSSVTKNLEKKLTEIFTIKSTSNYADLVFFDDDPPLVLEVKPNVERRSKLQNLKPFTPEWNDELKTELATASEKTRVFTEEQKRKIVKYQENRIKRWKQKLANDNDLILSDSFLELLKIEKKLVLPEFTAEMNSIISKSLMPRPSECVVSQCDLYSILYKDIENLKGLNWLNDEIINAYLSLIKERSKRDGYPSVYCFTTFFYPKLKSSGYSAVRRWTRKDDILSYDINLVPIHLGLHWCLCVIDYRQKKITYYDSLNGRENCVHILKDYLVSESRDKKKQDIDLSGWVFEKAYDIPYQRNSSDCGMFTLKYAEFITKNAKINFTQEHMPYFRRKMVYEIVTGQLV